MVSYDKIAYSAISMDQEPPQRRCDVCQGQMIYVGMLPAIGQFPLQDVYKCGACKLAVADTDRSSPVHGAR
jgi:hypothetical protein